MWTGILKSRLKVLKYVCYVLMFNTPQIEESLFWILMYDTKF